MKPNVLLAGGSGYIGKYISSVIEKMQTYMPYQSIQILKKKIMIELFG